MAVTFTRPFPIVYSADMQRAERFWTEGVGYAVLYRFPETGPAAYFAAGSGDARVGVSHLAAAESMHGVILPVQAKPTFEICMNVDNVDEAEAQLLAHGATPYRPAADMPWGERVALVLDPDQHVLHITGPAKGA